MRHLNDQYYGGNLLREVGAPAESTDAANKAYVDALQRPVFFGITNTAEATALKVVTLEEPASGFANGRLLQLYFTYAVPAGNDNAISVGGASYGLALHGIGITAAGVICAGDRVLLWCYNGFANVIAIDRWGADIAGKQDTLVGSGSGQNIKTINGQTILGSGDIALTPHLAYDNTVTPSSGEASVTFPAGSRKYFGISSAESLNLNITANNSGENYILVTNTGNADIKIGIGTVSYGNTPLTESDILIEVGGIICPKGTSVEISAVVFPTKAIVTSSLSLIAQSIA